MLGRPAAAAHARTACCSTCERVALQDVFDVLRRAARGLARRARQAHRPGGAARRRRPRGARADRRRRPARGRARPSLRDARRRRRAPRGDRPRRGRPVRGRGRRGACATPCWRRGPPRSARTRPRSRASRPGRPRYGVDLDDTVIPQEAGLNERAVSFTKGCYVGQETVARLHYRGKPNRHLRGLRLSAPVPAGTPLRLGDREVGRLDEQRRLRPRSGRSAWRIVRREAEPGATLAAGDGGATAEVVALPFTDARPRPPGRRPRAARADDARPHRRRTGRRGSPRAAPATGRGAARASPRRPPRRGPATSRRGAPRRRRRASATPCRRAARRGAGPPRCGAPTSSRSAGGSTGAQSTTRPPTSHRASKRPPRGCSARTSRGRAWVAATAPAEDVEQPGQALAAAAQPARALELLARGGAAHLVVDVGQQRRPAVALAGEERERLVEPAAVEVGVEVAQAGRQAAAHLAVGRRAVAPRERAAAVAQAEERVELLEQLDRRRAPAQRPDADAQPGGGRRGDLEHGERRCRGGSAGTRSRRRACGGRCPAAGGGG